MDNAVVSNDERDFSKNWVTSSRFIFYVIIFCLLAFVVGCSFQLYKHRWTGLGNPKVPESTLYSPKYTAPK